MPLSHLTHVDKDLRVMQQVGLSVAPAQAHRWTSERAHWRTLSRGGEGAARELCDLILHARDLRDAVLGRFAR